MNEWSIEPHLILNPLCSQFLSTFPPYFFPIFLSILQTSLLIQYNLGSERQVLPTFWPYILNFLVGLSFYYTPKDQPKDGLSASGLEVTAIKAPIIRNENSAYTWPPISVLLTAAHQCFLGFLISSLPYFPHNQFQTSTTFFKFPTPLSLSKWHHLHRNKRKVIRSDFLGFLPHWGTTTHTFPPPSWQYGGRVSLFLFKANL